MSRFGNGFPRNRRHRAAAPLLGVPVLCQPAEVAACAAGGDRWRMELLPAAARSCRRLLHDHVWDGGLLQIARTVAQGDEIAGFRVIELPGHAPDLIALFRERDRLALVSDALYVTNMWGRPNPPTVPEAAYNLDTDRARESLRQLADLYPRLVGVGHRGPLTGGNLDLELRTAANR